MANFENSYKYINISFIFLSLSVLALVLKVIFTAYEPPGIILTPKQGFKEYTIAAVPPLSAFEAVAVRNVFDPLRGKKDSTIKPDITELKAKPLPKFNLIGTVLLGNRKKALISSGGALHKSSVYSVGDSIEGFTVVEILKNKVVFEKGGDFFEIKMVEDTSTRSH